MQETHATTGKTHAIGANPTQPRRQSIERWTEGKVSQQNSLLTFLVLDKPDKENTTTA